LLPPAPKILFGLRDLSHTVQHRLSKLSVHLKEGYISDVQYNPMSIDMLL